MSIVKLPNCDVFTFSRDENFNRPFSEPTFIQPEIFGPIDLQAEGTWIAWNGKSVMSLQNGGKLPHKRELPYTISRGQLLINLLEFDDFERLKQLINNNKVEPFTICIFRTNQLEKELVIWDGELLLNEQVPFQNKWLNCSSTLYNDEDRIQFEDAIANEIFYTPEEIYEFHLKRIIGSSLNPVKKPVTSSITQFVTNGIYTSCRFTNLIESKDYFYKL